MNIAIVYVFPNLNYRVYEPMAQRFVRTYIEHPPGQADHELYVAVNGAGPITLRQEQLFSPLVPKFFYHDNSGKDIGAYQAASKTISCDLLICLGAPLRCNKNGWLDRIVEVYEDHGPGLYGPYCFSSPRPHVRTTCFWLPPQLLASYPRTVSNGYRYEFEHGSNSIADWSMKQGFPVIQVAWSEAMALAHCKHVEPEDCLFLDQHYERSVPISRG